MEVKQIIAELDKQIANLREARALLAEETFAGTKRGAATGAARGTTKRNLTPEGRKRISEALRRRWAERRKAVAKAEKSAKAA